MGRFVVWRGCRQLDLALYIGTPEGLEAPKQKPIESKPLSDGLRAFLSSDTANDMKSDAVRLRESLFNVFERFLRLAEFA